MNDTKATQFPERYWYTARRLTKFRSQAHVTADEKDRYREALDTMLGMASDLLFETRENEVGAGGINFRLFHPGHDDTKNIADFYWHRGTTILFRVDKSQGSWRLLD